MDYACLLVSSPDAPNYSMYTEKSGVQYDDVEHGSTLVYSPWLYLLGPI